MARTRLSGVQVHDEDFYLQSEGDTLSGTLSARIDAKPDTLLELTDTPSSYDVDKYLKSTTSGTEWSAVAASAGGGLQWTVISGSTTASDGNGYLINASNNDVVLSLPSSPNEGDMVGFCDFYSAALANTITISGSGSNIFGSSEPLIVDVIGAAGTLVYTDATRGWEITTEVGSVTQTTFNYQNYVDREDTGTDDFTLSDLTTDGTWRDLDLSNILPSNAVAVVFRVTINDNAANSYIRFRKNGYTNNEISNIVRTQAANQVNDGTCFVGCDSNQIIEYQTTNTTFTSIVIQILGWFTDDDQTAVGSGNVYAPSDLTDNYLIRGDGGAKNVQTSTVKVSDDGEMTNTSQPCFSTNVNTTQHGVTGDGTAYNITGSFFTEITDQGSNLSNGTFTAPVGGNYLLSGIFDMNNITGNQTYILCTVVTSNRSYQVAYFDKSVAAADNFKFAFAVVADMDALDTAYMQLRVYGSSKDVNVVTGTYFQGHLIC